MSALDIWSEALEYAARMTGSDKLAVRVRAISEECLGEWQRQHAEWVARCVQVVGGIEGLEAMK
jgi:hypothetical protein